MMDPVHPWVDPSEMMRLAEALMFAPAKAPETPEDTGFGGDFVGYAGLGPSPVPTPAPPTAAETIVLTPRSEDKSMQERIAEAALHAQHIPATTNPAQPAEVWPTRAGPLPPLQRAPTTQAPQPPIAEPPSAPFNALGPFIERVSRFRDELHAQFRAKGVFILDKEGSIIFDESDHSRLHFIARSLAMARKKSNGGLGNVHVKVGSTNMLEVIPVDTAYGRIVLGLLVEKALSSEAIIHIIQALKSAVAPPQH
ncbi:MAG: hypothetical protein B9S37_09555 [Verrucomicrobiia bacterium Tous-C3TDCM]|nr:MAG: hypothetical protein B9S37_09555 [Verrucomicrobiae bacterium Tous-C3TDCM]